MNVLSQLGNGIINSLNWAAWDLNSFLKNAGEAGKTWGGSFIILLGVIAIIYAAYQIITGLISHGKKQVNWGVTIILLLVGGACMTGGFTLMSTLASGGQKTIEDLGRGGANLWLMLRTVPWI